MPGRGLEPLRPCGAADFKSAASAVSPPRLASRSIRRLQARLGAAGHLHEAQQHDQRQHDVDRQHGEDAVVAEAWQEHLSGHDDRERDGDRLGGGLQTGKEV